MLYHLLLVLGISLFTSFSCLSQDWQLLSFDITSQIGNNNCHARNQNHLFHFDVTLPPSTTITQGDDVYEETYEVVVANAVGTEIHGQGLSFAGIPLASLDLGAVTTGSFQGKLQSNATTLAFEISINGRYVRTHTYTNAQGDKVTDVLEDQVTNFRSSAFVFNGPPTFEVTPILVNGVPMANLNLNDLNPCQVYTLTAGAVGATAYQWNLPDPSWLVSAPSSLTSSSIDVSIDWATIEANPVWLALPNLRQIKLDVFQDCNDSRITKSSTLLPRGNEITINGNPICHRSNGTTILSVPDLGTNATLNWVVDDTKLTIVSGQGTNRIEIEADNYYRTYTPIVLNVTSPCGTAQLVENHWIGAPLPQSSTLAGISTARPGNIRTFIGSHGGNEITNYSWSIPSLVVGGQQPPILNHCSDCWILRSAAVTTNSSNEEIPYASIQIGRTSGYVQVIYENVCGTAAAIRYVTVEHESPDDNLCCDAPNARIVNPNPNATVSLDGQRISYGFDTETEVDILNVSAVNVNKGRIYPNPAIDVVHVEISVEDWTEKGATIVLYHLASGQKIQTTITVQNTTLDVAELPAGVYLLDIITEKNTRTEKIVIKH